MSDALPAAGLRVRALAERLTRAGRTLATAESCTGGGLAALLTSEPGSSSWFERGFVTYSNAAKIELLRVPAAVLAEAGAVSEATARAMAEGGLQVAPVDLVVAVTGIAGPSGGRPGKPVGTVCIAVASRFAATAARTCLFPGDRQAVREQSVWTALEALLEYQK